MLEQKLCLHLLLRPSLELSALARTNQQDIMQVLQTDVCRKGVLLCEKMLQNCLAVLKRHRRHRCFTTGRQISRACLVPCEKQQPMWKSGWLRSCCQPREVTG